MKSTLTLILLGVSFLALAQNFPIGHRSINFKDPARSGGFSIGGGTTMPTGGTGRDIGTEVYYPATSAGDNTPFATGNFPLVVIGHGFAMTWDAYKTLTDSLVRNGFIVALPRTEGSLLPAPNHLDFGKDLAKVAELFAAQNTVSGSVFNGKHNGRTAIGGHSMGGGATFLADAFAPASVLCYFTFAAAETNPKSSSAAKTITRPHLLFAGTYDCVAPPAQHQTLMWDSLLVSTCKTYINITKAYHCAFADNNFNCGFGEGTCITAGGYSATAQQALVRRYLNPYLDYYLKGVCGSWTNFQSMLDTTTTANVQRVCNNQIPQNAAISGNNTFCTSNNTLLTAAPTGFTYNWSNGANTSSISVGTAGNYTVSVGNGICEITSSPFAVSELAPPAPLVSLMGSDTVCSGIASLVYTTDVQSGVTYDWTLPQGWSISNGNNTSTITATSSAQSGTISVSAQNTCGNSNVLSLNVTVKPSNLGTAGSITGNTITCANTAQTYSIATVNGADNYVWTLPQGWTIVNGDGTTSISVTPSSSGTINVSAENSCGATAPSSLSITVNDAPQLSGSILGPDTICIGNTTGVYYAVNQVSNANDYTWNLPNGWTFVGSGNTFAPIINISGSGTLSVSASNTCGSSNSLQLPIIVVDTPQVSIIQNGNILSALPTTAGDSYQWYLNGNPTGGSSSTITATANGDYSVVVTNSNTLCVGTAKLSGVIVSGIENVFLSSIQVFPNPAKSVLIMTIPQYPDATKAVLTDLYGRTIFEQPITTNVTQLEVSELSAGVYVLNINTNYGTKTVRVVVEK
ncbi:MAG: T9SS type A sorting domain-containing protein [Chitinophagales bacterium]|nr:T9SS type A sorting domain-containing protein [Chitinophagales bacterium]